MNIETYWSDYSSAEKDLFQKSCRRLLKSTFIVRDKDDEQKKAYYFISKKPEPFSLYFGYIGFDVMIDRENGVIMLRNCADMGENGKLQYNRISLKKIESVVLCCLWILYADRIHSGSLSQAILISVADLSFELDKYGVKELIDNKKLLTDILGLFSRFNLVEVKGKIGDAECLIRLLPSLQFALDEEEFSRFVDITQKRMAATDSDPENMDMNDGDNPEDIDMDDYSNPEDIDMDDYSNPEDMDMDDYGNPEDSEEDNDTDAGK